MQKNLVFVMPDSQLICHLSMVQNQSIVKFAIRRLIIFNKYRRERYPLLHSLSLIIVKKTSGKALKFKL